MAMQRVSTEDVHVSTPSSLRVGEWTDGAAWDGFVDGSDDGTIAHRWVWSDVVARSYRLRPSMLAAVSDGRIRGVLPLVTLKSRMFGRHVVSMPFLDVGGLCTNGDDEAGAALLAAAMELAEKQQAHLELRHTTDRPLGLPRSLEKVTMRLPLGTEEEALFSSLPSNRRGQIRKGRRAGLEATFHGPEAVGDLFRVLAENMRDLGSPTHGRNYFEALIDGLGDRAEIVLVRDGATVLGAGIVLYDRDLVMVPWSSSLRHAFKLAPNQVLYWEVMRRGIERGVGTFDFGRSSVGSGTYVAKGEWGAKPVQLYWDYFPEGDGPPGEEISNKSWAVDIWRRLPLPVAGMIGPRIRKRIPN
ncbi:MAG: FemAB family XrtA/PEP-CTERM system-associated protein [Actinomycetota bacterium]